MLDILIDDMKFNFEIERFHQVVAIPVGTSFESV